MMNPDRRTDPLLRGTRLLLIITMGLAVVVGIGLCAAIPSVWMFSNRVVVEAAKNGIRLDGQDALLAVSVLLAAGAVLTGLGFLFLRKLVAIIDTVGEGSPFIPENAARLRAMGWLALAFQVLTLLTAPAEFLISRAIPDSHVEVSANFFGLITALLLFVLARVFEHGTRLAEDVEGTV